MKKGQITIFIILGIVIVLVAGLVLYVTRKETAQPVLSIDRSVISDYISSCLSQTATQGIYKLAGQGGYVNPKGDLTYGEPGDGLPAHYFFESHTLPYVLDGNKTSMRRLSHISPLLSRYIAVELPKCLNFTAFDAQGYTASVPEIDWQAIDFDFARAQVPYSSEPIRFAVIPRGETGDVAIVANYPILFANEKQSFVLSEFTTTVPLRLALLEKIAQKLVNEIALAHSNNTGYNLFMHCEEYASPDKQVNIYSTWNPHAHDYAVSIVDASPLLRRMAPLRYQFAVRNVNFGGLCVG